MAKIFLENCLFLFAFGLIKCGNKKDDKRDEHKEQFLYCFCYDLWIAIIFSTRNLSEDIKRFQPPV